MPAPFDVARIADGDGVPDGVDNCIGSDMQATVIIKGCNTKAGNDVPANDCTVADDINQCQIDFAGKPLHQLACAITKADRLRKAGIITTKEAAGILTCSILTLGR